jgi:hypothetical protein
LDGSVSGSATLHVDGGVQRPVRRLEVDGDLD